MIKNLIAAGFLLAFTSLPLLAQQTTTPDVSAQTNGRMGRNQGMNRQQRPMADAPTRARKMTDRMTQQLGLDQATSAKVYDAALARDQKIDNIQKGTTDDNRTKAQALKANADDFRSKLQGILTPDQFTKFEAMRNHGRRNKGGADANNSNSENN
ncbi:MAG: DUF4890 domain-containing protein [Spirosoma sp.]|nr:DUF4890 domain-containing protein [Spirosoma sp.]